MQSRRLRQPRKQGLASGVDVECGEHIALSFECFQQSPVIFHGLIHQHPGQLGLASLPHGQTDRAQKVSNFLSGEKPVKRMTAPQDFPRQGDLSVPVLLRGGGIIALQQARNRRDGGLVLPGRGRHGRDHRSDQRR